MVSFFSKAIVYLVDVGCMSVLGLEQRLERCHVVNTAPIVAQHTTTWSTKNSLVGKHLHKVELVQFSVTVRVNILHEVDQPSIVRQLEELIDVPLCHPLTLLLRQESAV